MIFCDFKAFLPVLSILSPPNAFYPVNYTSVTHSRPIKHSFSVRYFSEPYFQFLNPIYAFLHRLTLFTFVQKKAVFGKQLTTTTAATVITAHVRDHGDQRQEHGYDNTADDNRKENDHDRFQ
jgi:hypothetical protein